VQAFDESVVGSILSTMAQLKAMLIKQHTINGVEPQFFPEFVITGDLIEGAMPGKPGAKLMGIIDLLVVDANGVPHIYDYKTSDKEPSKWVQAKEDAFQSQTGAYREMLRAWKFDVDNTRIGIIPLLMDNF
jgi:ATP-dependent exoDNAse (exonuclease V) beta subunit